MSQHLPDTLPIPLYTGEEADMARAYILGCGVRVPGHLVMSSVRDGEPRHTLEKIEMDALVSDPIALDGAADMLASAEAIRDFEPDVIIAAPNGATPIVNSMLSGGHLDAQRAHMLKLGRSKFIFRTPADRERARSARRLLVVDDVLSTGGNAANVLRLSNITGDETDREAMVAALYGRAPITDTCARLATYHAVTVGQIKDYAPAECPGCNLPWQIGDFVTGRVLQS